jgi:hypothetical protein
MKDKCVLCNKETAYNFTDHIDIRSGYVEGVGQFCMSCYNGNKETTDIHISNRLVTETPNDMELGGKIRRLFWEKNETFR